MSTSTTPEALADAELARMGVPERDTRALRGPIARNIRNWQERLATDPPATGWQILEALLARADATYGAGHLLHAEQLEEARRLASALPTVPTLACLRVGSRLFSGPHLQRHLAAYRALASQPRLPGT